MNIILKEMRSNLVALIVWSLSLGAVVFIAFIEYEAYNNNPEILAFMDAFPPEMMAAFGFGSANLTTLPGFTSLFSIYYYLTLAIHAGLLGTGIISKEERDKTAEFLYTLPVERNKVILSKLVAAVLNCLIFLVLTLGFTYAASYRYGPDQAYVEFLLILGVGLFLIQLIFLTIGMALSSVIKDHKLPSRIILGAILGTWALSSVVSIVEDIEFMKYFTPFKYFEAAIIVDTMELELVFIFISIGIIAAALGVVFTMFKKRDLFI